MFHASRQGDLIQETYRSETTQSPTTETTKVIRRQMANPRYGATLDLRESSVTTAAADETGPME